MRVLAAVAVSVGLLAGSAVAMADNTSIVKLVSFENPQNGLGLFTYRWTLGATINSVTRVDHPTWAATGDGAAQINCTFGGYGDKAVAGATFYSASSGSTGMNLANLGYNHLLAAVAVDNSATFVPNGLIIKLYDKTGPGWFYRSGGNADIASANTWYLLSWPISGAGDLTDVRELGIDMWSDTQYSGNVYVNFLGVSANVPEPATLSLLALGGMLIARRRRAASVLPVLLAAGLLAGSTNPASAVQAVPALTIDGSPGYSWAGIDIVRGWEFATNANVTVSALGVYDASQWMKDIGSGDGLSAVHPVGIWDCHNVLVASASVPAGTSTTLIDGFRYISIPGVQLKAGQKYVIGALYHDDDGDANIDSRPVTFRTDPSISYTTSRQLFFWGNGGTLSPPTDSTSWPGYFGPNFLVPEPATLALLGLGGLLLARRRRA